MKGNTTIQMDKRSILDRMIKVAANYLGVKRNESLDSVVMLFIESLGEEIYKLSGEINNIENRLSETLLNALNPDISISSAPAHCILHATAEETQTTITKETLFTAESKQSGQLSFYPVCNTKIHKGDIHYIIRNGLCYSVDMHQTKTLIARSRGIESTDKKSFWIGLELDENIHTLEGLSFYFDIPVTTDKDEYFNLLPYTTWRLNGNPVNLKQGIPTIERKTDNAVINTFSRFDISNNLDDAILSLYKEHFLTITDDIDIQREKKVFPEELKSFFPQQFMDDFVKPILWLEITFPWNIKPAIVESMNININAFPVANKTLHSKIVELDEALPVIPMETGNNEYLISIHSVLDSQGREYYELPFESNDEKEFRTYSVRRGGYERYDKRDALEYLSNLSNILENQYSSRFGDSSDNDWAEEIQQQIYDLVKQLKKSIAATKDKAEIQSYIHIDQLKNDDIFFVKYWTTSCEQANNIKQETYMSCALPDAQINSESIFSLSVTKGGKSAPQAVEKQNLRMKSLTESAIITNSNDIERFCKMSFKDTYQKIDVKKGLCPLTYPEYGFINTIDVFLTPKNGLNHLFGEKDEQIVKQLLIKNSPATFNYRIFIDTLK